MPVVEIILLCLIPSAFGSAFVAKYFKCHNYVKKKTTNYDAEYLAENVEDVGEVDDIIVGYHKEKLIRDAPVGGEFDNKLLVDVQPVASASHGTQEAPEEEPEATYRMLSPQPSMASPEPQEPTIAEQEHSSTALVPYKVGARSRRRARAREARSRYIMDLAMYFGRQCRFEFGFNTKSEANIMVARRYIRDELKSHDFSSSEKMKILALALDVHSSWAISKPMSQICMRHPQWLLGKPLRRKRNGPTTHPQ